MKTLFVHGRPNPHPLHGKYGQSIGAEFKFVDPWFRWHDQNLFFAFRYLFWFLNSFYFLSWRRTLIVSEGLHLTVVLVKFLSFGRTKIVILVDDESPYFIMSKYYGAISRRVNTWAYRQYDAFICIGEMETDLVKKILKGRNKPLTSGFNGVANARLPALLNCSSDHSSKRIVFIANGPDGWRTWYKGLDLMLKVIATLVKDGTDLYFEIAGNWDKEFVGQLLDHLNPDCRNRVSFKGPVSNVSEFLDQSRLYLHIARGEAWGISILESMAAGIIPIVSEWTGAKECVVKVSPSLIVPIDEELVVQRMRTILLLPDSEKKMWSLRCKEIASEYTEEKAIARFVENFENLLRQLQS